MTSIHHLTAAPLHRKPLSPQPQCVSIHDFARQFGFQPDPAQSELLAAAGPRVIVNCTRQWGKSTVVALRAAWHAHTQPGSDVVVVSRSRRQSAEFLRKVSSFLAPVRRHRDLLFLPNGSRILGLPPVEQTIRGFSASMLVLDEAACIPDPVYDAVLPMLAATAGSLWLLSTPRGKRGFFWEEWMQGESWHRVSVPATNCPRISPAFLDEMLRKRGETRFRQEYLCEFTAGDNALFDRDDLESLFASIPAFSTAAFQPLTPTSDFILGVDLGKLADASAVAILERISERDGIDRVSMRDTFRTRHVLRHLERIRLGTAYPRVVERVRELAEKTALIGKVTLAVDATGLGEPVFDAMRASGMPGELIAVTLTGGDISQRSSFRWYVPRKELLVGLQGQVCRRELEIASALPLADDFVEEMANMGRSLHPAAGSHDDLVMAVALAAWCARRRPRGRMFPRAHEPLRL